MQNIKRTMPLVKVSVILAALILLVPGLCFAGRLGELFTDFQAPQGFVADATTDHKIIFLNKEENITMTVIGPIPENDATRVKDEVFTKGIIAGLEDTKRVRINSHEITSVEGLTWIRLSGTADMGNGGEWVPRKSVTISLADSMFEVALYGANINFRNTDDIFSAVIKHLKSKF